VLRLVADRGYLVGLSGAGTVDPPARQVHQPRDREARLFISEATVEAHLLHIYARLEVHDRASEGGRGLPVRLLRTDG
jgi:hypothetical protein